MTASIWAISAGQPDLIARGRSALDAGLDRLLIREPRLPDPDALARLAGDFPARVVLHARTVDAPAMARALGLGLHLPSGDRWPPSDRWPPGDPPVSAPRFGRSCHSPAEVRAAAATGCAWAFLSPIWAPISKPEDRRPPLGPTALRGLDALDIEVIALGGITVENARACLEAGAFGVATMSGILGAADPGRAVEAWKRAGAA